MERDTLGMLGNLEKAARRPELKALLKAHAEETKQQIANIERSFELLGGEDQRFAFSGHQSDGEGRKLNARQNRQVPG